MSRQPITAQPSQEPRYERWNIDEEGESSRQAAPLVRPPAPTTSQSASDSTRSSLFSQNRLWSSEPSRPQRKLRLLSLDGGGVRGLAALLILDQLMHTINCDDPPKPCDYFDMIGGTSTGGLIAIMLGRLQMTIKDCILAYTTLMSDIFKKANHRLSVGSNKKLKELNTWVDVRGKFDETVLEEAIKKILREKGFGEDELLKDLRSSRCKVFVCATSSDRLQTVILPSYFSAKHPASLFNCTTIVQAARATSSATTFFNPTVIIANGSPETFVDGGVGANNPVFHVFTEALNTFGERYSSMPGQFRDHLACLVSIGTGLKSLEGCDPTDPLGIQTLLVSIATETEATHSRFSGLNPELLQNPKRFIRFNPTGLENIKMDQPERKGDIEIASRRYFQQEGFFDDIVTCKRALEAESWAVTGPPEISCYKWSRSYAPSLTAKSWSTPNTLIQDLQNSEKFLEQLGSGHPMHMLIKSTEVKEPLPDLESVILIIHALESSDYFTQDSTRARGTQCIFEEPWPEELRMRLLPTFDTNQIQLSIGLAWSSDDIPKGLELLQRNMARLRNLTSFSTRRRACLSFLKTLATLLENLLAFFHTQVTFSELRIVYKHVHPLPKKLKSYATDVESLIKGKSGFPRPGLIDSNTADALIVRTEKLQHDLTQPVELLVTMLGEQTLSAIFKVPTDMQETGARLFETTLQRYRNSGNCHSDSNFSILPMGSGGGRSYHFSETVDEYLRASKEAFKKSKDGDAKNNSTVTIHWALVGNANLIIRSALFVLKDFVARGTFQGLIIFRDLPKVTENCFIFEDALGRIYDLDINSIRHWTVFVAFLKAEFKDVPGCGRVLADMYIILLQENQIIFEDNWNELVGPGTELCMSMLVAPTKGTCPRCLEAVGTIPSPDNAWYSYTCKGCHLMCGESHFADLEKRHESMAEMFYRVMEKLFDPRFLHDSGYQMPQKKRQGGKVTFSQNGNSGLEIDALDAEESVPETPVPDPGQRDEDMKLFKRAHMIRRPPTNDTPDEDSPTTKSQLSKGRIWNTSPQEERQSIKEFWLSLGREERRALVMLEKDAVLKKMKEQQKNVCSCVVCSRKRTAIEEELEVLYDAYYEELEQYANDDGPAIPMMPLRRFSNLDRLQPPDRPSPAFNGQSSRGQIVEELRDDQEDDEENSDWEEYEDDYSDEDPEETPRPIASGSFNFGNSLTVHGGILTVTDDLLKNDGKKFIEMIEIIAERRMARKEEPQPNDDKYNDDYSSKDDDDDGEMDTITEEERMEEGRRMFQIFAARMFEQRILIAYREKVARERQAKLVEEIEEERR